MAGVRRRWPSADGPATTSAEPVPTVSDPGLTKVDLKRAARTYAASRRYAEACDLYVELLASYRESMAPEERGQVLLDHGLCLLRSERPLDGVVQLRQAVKLLPRSDRAYFKLGLGLGRLKQLEASVEALRRATELSPQTAHYFSRLALGLTFLGRQDDALSVYRQALSIDPSNPEAQAALAKAALDA